VTEVAGARCPICGQAVARAQAGKLWPFCGERCWAVDLGKWLGEEYRLSDPSAEAVQLPGGSDEA
jgi:hypothetical protein